MLVCFSMLIWGTPVSPLQFFGYSIALCGMLYYKLGAEQIKGYFSQAGRSWNEFGLQRPGLRRALIFVLVIITFLVLMGGLGTTFAPEATRALSAKTASVLNGGKPGS